MSGLRERYGVRVCALLIAAEVIVAGAVVAGAQGMPGGTAHSVTLGWQAPSPVGGSGTISGYNVYRSPLVTSASAGTFAKINSAVNAGLTYTDTSVSAGTGYTYCVTTVDSLGEESACSTAANATVPANPNAPSAPLITVK